MKKIKEHNGHKKDLHDGFVNKFLAVNQYFSRQNLDTSQDNIDKSFTKPPASPKETITLSIPYQDNQNPRPMTLSLFTKFKHKTHQASQNQSKQTTPSHQGLLNNLSGPQTTADENPDLSRPLSQKDNTLSSFLGMKHVIDSRKKKEAERILKTEDSENYNIITSRELRPSTSAANIGRKHVKSTERLKINTKREAPRVNLLTEGQDNTTSSPFKELKQSSSSTSLHRRNLKSIEKLRVDLIKEKPNINLFFDEQPVDSPAHSSTKTLKKCSSLKNRLTIHPPDRSPELIKLQELGSYQNDRNIKTTMSDIDERFGSAKLLYRAATPLVRGYQTNEIQLFGTPRPQLYVSNSHRLSSNLRSPLTLRSAAVQVIPRKEALDFFEEGRRSGRVATACISQRQNPEGHLRKKSLKVTDIRIVRNKKTLELETSKERLSPSKSPDSFTINKLDRLDVQKLQLRNKIIKRRTGY